MTRCKTITFLLFCLCNQLQYAQLPEDIIFTHINTGNGLSTDNVRNIYQDSRGLIWICTTDGLNRYDGGSFKIYKHHPNDSNSLPGNDIWDIAEDSKGNFWVGTQTGLCYFEPRQNRFTNYIYEPGNKNSLAYMRAENIIVDEEDILWVGSLNGLQKFNPVTRKFQLLEFATKEELAKNVNLGAVYYMYLDKKKQLWVLAGGRLYLINKKNLTAILKVERWRDNLGVTSIFEDSNGQYWLTFWGQGVAKYDGVQSPAPENFIYTKDIFGRVVEWKGPSNSHWMVFTHQNGVFFYRTDNGESRFFYHDASKPGSFAAHNGGEIITDLQNNIWVATDKGIERIEPAKQFFNYHYLGEKKDREDYYYFGTPFPVLKDGSHYWAGLWNANGLMYLDSNWKLLKQYKHIPPASVSENSRTIFDIIKTNTGHYWITTNEALVYAGFSSNKFQKFIPADIKPEAFEFREMIMYGNKLFIRTRHYGIYCFNTETLSFENHFTKENSGLPHDDVNDMVLSKEGEIWMATTDGICKLNIRNRIITETHTSFSNKKTNAFCRTIDIDSKGNVWTGTISGLAKFEPEIKKFTEFTTADGLCHGHIFHLKTDMNDNLWMITQNGVSLYKQKENQFQNFFKEDGLPKNSLDGKIFMDEKGIIYLTDAGIVITVNPNEIPANMKKPPVLITDATVGSQHYTILLNAKKEKQLISDFKNNSVEINFSVLNYNSPGLNRYYYKLEGIDNTWHSSNRGIAAYNSLPHGNYVLRVKGSNNSGVMNEDGDLIHIIITPLWYQTWWFKAILALAGSLIIIYFVRRRIRTIRTGALLKQKVAETEMQALRAQMNPHFIFNSLNSIENFIMQNEKRLASDYLNKFSKLIRSILDSSRNEVVPVAKDMEALQLYVDLELLRFNNKFTFKVVVDPVLLSGDYRVPSLLIQPYVENAILHGLAHSEEKNLTLIVSVTLENETIKYLIQDNGIGRQKAGEYNRQNKPHHKSVGLQITEDRIKAFNKSDQNAISFTDLYDSNNKPCGTKVEITIKAI